MHQKMQAAAAFVYDRSGGVQETTTQADREAPSAESFFGRTLPGKRGAVV
jgi:hypothetical protein